MSGSTLMPKVASADREASAMAAPEESNPIEAAQDASQSAAYHFPEEVDLSGVTGDEHVDDTKLIETLRAEFDKS